MELPIRPLTQDVCVAPQLTPEAMAEVAKAGFRSVVNNRPDFEHGPDQPTNADAFRTPAGDLTAAIVDAIHAVTGRRPDLSTTGGTSDARFVKDYCPVVEFGLVGSTMHMVDERAPVAEIQGLVRVYEGVLRGYFQAFAQG